MSQNVLNLVDAGMVGRLGDSALAAAGIGSFATYMSIAFILGLSTGVQALAARRLGEGRIDETAVPLNGGLILAVLLGIPLTILMISIAPQFVALLSPDPEVVGQAAPYLQVRVVAVVAVGMNFSFRGYWSAVHMTGLYLRTILVMHALNIFLNWVLIFGHLGAPALGVYGAGLATSISLRRHDNLFLPGMATRQQPWLLAQTTQSQHACRPVQAVTTYQYPAIIVFRWHGYAVLDPRPDWDC